MKKLYATSLLFIKAVLLVILVCISSLFTSAQTSSADRKSSNAYRNNYQRVATGSTSESTFEIRDDGTLWAWGRNDKGQLGDNTLVDKSTPIQIGFDDNWTSVTAAYDYTVGIKTNGTLWAWGDNEVGQLGDGTTISKTIPTQITTDNNWVSVATGGTITVALKSDGTLWSWGYYAYYDTSYKGSNAPLQIGTDNNWASISTGNMVPSAIKSDGTLWDLHSDTNTMYTTQVGTDSDWVKSSTSSYHTVAIKSNGTIWIWGNNMFGQLGNGSTIDNNTPAQMGTDNKWVDIVVGDAHTIALKSDGTLWAWGDNRNGQLGDGTETNKTEAVQIGVDNKWVDMIAGGYYTLGVKADGTLWAWGKNENGQLGDGSTINKNIPTQVSYTSSGVFSSAFGDTHTIALKTDGSLWTWGKNNAGQLGDRAQEDKQAPNNVNNNSWIATATSLITSIGLKSDGTLWSWGSGNFQAPSQLNIGNDWVSISAGFTNNIALKSDGTICTIGNSAVQVGTDKNWVSISAGANYNIALKSDGTMWAWGNNEYGQLGYNPSTTSSSNQPLKIGTGNNWRSISAGSYHNVAIQSNGSMWAWGLNDFGQLGDGTTTNKFDPVLINSSGNWINAVAGHSFTSAISSDGALWSWGSNDFGEFGDGTQTGSIIPKMNKSVNNVIDISTLSIGNILGIIKANRTNLCLTGSDQNQQLGNGTANSVTNFNCIPLIQSALPLQLTNYSIKLINNSVINTWQTANEINVSHINVQRSTDGVNFITIGKENSKGGGLYSFTDKVLPANIATLYYRLETVDMDGSNHISNVLAINLLINPSATLSIFPNPITDKQFSIKLDQLPKGIYQVSISDMLGRNVKTLSFSYDGKTLIKTIFADFPAGAYLLKVFSVSYSETRKLLVN